MIKTVGVVSLSAGTLGEDFVRHELELGVRRLEHYGLKVKFLPHALKGIDYLKAHPEARAADLLDEPRPFLMLEGVRSGTLLRELTKSTPPEDVFLNVNRDMGPFLEAHRGRKGVVVGDLLAVEACGRFPPEDLAVISALGEDRLFPPGLTVIPVPNRDRAAAAVEVAMELMSLDYDPDRDHRILLRADG